MNQSIHPKRLVSLLFIIAIAVVFTLQFGPGSRGCDAPLRSTPAASAAVVNGKEISLIDFNRAYVQQLQMFRAQGNAIPAALARQLGLPQQVLDQLVMMELLAQAAEKEGIAASDAELREVLQRNPDFQKDGRFDLKRYQDVVSNYYGKRDTEYEADLRRRLAAGKLLELVEAGAVVSEDEVKAKYFRDGNKANATLVRFLPTMFADKVPAAKPDELARFEKEHAKDIADYYEANRFLYRQPERVRARHILIKVEKDAPEAEKDDARQKIERIRQEIEAGKDFAQAAKEYSEDPGSKDSGGDLGFNERSSWVPEFANAAFALKPGEMSKPVESQFGFHLIKMEERKPPESKELEQVKGEIARQLLNKDKAKQLARAAADKALSAALKSGKKLAQLYPTDKDKEGKPAKGRFETETKPTAVETGLFSFNGDNVPQLGAQPQLAREIFEAGQPQLLDKVYSAGEGFALAEVTERKRPSESEFASQKDALRNDALKAQQLELRESFLKALKKRANIKTNDQALGAVANAS
ncbi:MAG TPA: SurA N-terminal domain-containing protein [Myxococcaceae bacterium]|nr:SurA N-terminal domain-containing protein [Myxococcaceae bacterium]